MCKFLKFKRLRKENPALIRLGDYNFCNMSRFILDQEELMHWIMNVERVNPPISNKGPNAEAEEYWEKNTREDEDRETSEDCQQFKQQRCEEHGERRDTKIEKLKKK